MSATPFLNDPSTPGRLHDLRESIKKAVDRDDRGRMYHLELELKRLSASIRDEVRSLGGRADPDLLIALWSSAQMTHARGVEYAGEGSVPGPDDDADPGSIHDDDADPADPAPRITSPGA